MKGLTTKVLIGLLVLAFIGVAVATAAENPGPDSVTGDNVKARNCPMVSGETSADQDHMSGMCMDTKDGDTQRKCAMGDNDGTVDGTESACPMSGMHMGMMGEDSGCPMMQEGNVDFDSMCDMMSMHNNENATLDTDDS